MGSRRAERVLIDLRQMPNDDEEYCYILQTACDLRSGAQTSIMTMKYVKKHAEARQHSIVDDPWMQEVSQTLDAIQQWVDEKTSAKKSDSSEADIYWDGSEWVETGRFSPLES